MDKKLTAVSKQRLTKMVDFLRNKVNKSHFNLRSYMDSKTEPSNEAIVNNLTSLAKGIEAKCDTTACACGWLPAIFPRQLKWAHDTRFGPDVVPRNYVYPNEESEGTEDTESTSKAFLGLSDIQFEYLFLPGSYHPSKRGPKSVAARIEKFVERDGKVPLYKFYLFHDSNT